jgi:hypothetical protein
MKRVILMGLVTVVLASVYSSVYACDHSTKKTVVTTSTSGKTIRTLVIGATTGCSATEPVPVMSFDIDVPGRTNHRFVHLEAHEKVSNPSALRTAVVLGRAFVTTVEAIMGTLRDAVSEKTASLV